MKYIFIVNPVAGLVDKTEQIREFVSKRDDIEGIVFNTEETGHETSIMKEMLDIFDDEDVRICVCGGSGTLSKTLDAIDIDDMDHVEVMYYPCGLTNDYLKNFNEKDREKFEDLSLITEGKAEYVDFIRCVIDGNKNNVQNELLFATVGISANIEKTSRALRFLAGLSPAFMYGLATLLVLPFSNYVEYEVIIDGVDYSRDYKLIYVGNGLCMGGSFVPIKKDIDCRDGYINVLLLKKLPPFKMLKYLTEFMHGEIADRRKEDVTVVKCKEISIRRKDGRPMRINADGELYVNYSWHMKAVGDKLRFVIPEGVEFVSCPDDLVKCLGLC